MKSSKKSESSVNEKSALVQNQKSIPEAKDIQKNAAAIKIQKFFKSHAIPEKYKFLELGKLGNYDLTPTSRTPH
jgi:hypothetical protein